MKVENPTTVSYDDDIVFQLQWAQTSGSCTSGLTWTDISTTNDAWEMVDTEHISPNGQISANQFLTNSSGNTHIQSE